MDGEFHLRFFFGRFGFSKPLLEKTDCVAALFQSLLLLKKLCNLSFVGSEVDLSEILEFLNPAQCHFPSVQTGHFLLNLGDSSIQLVSLVGQPRDLFPEAAALFPVPPKVVALYLSFQFVERMVRASHASEAG